MERAEVLRLIAEVHENLGIYYNDPEHLEITRENFKVLNELRLARNKRQVDVEERKGAFKKAIADFASSIAGKIVLVVVIAMATWLAPILPTVSKAIEKVFQ